MAVRMQLFGCKGTKKNIYSQPGGAWAGGLKPLFDALRRLGRRRARVVNNHDNCRRQSLQGRCSPAEQPVLARQTAHSTCQDGPFGGLTAPVAQCTVAQRVAPNARHGNTILQNVAPAKPSGAMQPRARGGIKQRQGHRKTIALPQQVGMTGLEPATSRPPDACANQLRYIPIKSCNLSELRCKGSYILWNMQIFGRLFLHLPATATVSAPTANGP